MKDEKPTKVLWQPHMMHFSEKDIPKKYSVTKMVGSGSYGVVALALNREAGEKVYSFH